MNTHHGIRVTLRGSVTRLSCLRNSFILCAPDGRGLLIQAKARQETPADGVGVQTTGTLVFDERDSPSLRLDSWVALADVLRPATREVDVGCLGVEDYWSLVSREDGRRAVVDGRTATCGDLIPA